MAWLRMALLFVRNIFRDRGELAIENLALRQQLALFHAKKKRPRIRQLDRIFWVWLSRLWSNWHTVLVIVQPETGVRWHQQGFRLYRRWKSRARKVGRPKIDSLPPFTVKSETQTNADKSREVPIPARAIEDITEAIKESFRFVRYADAGAVRGGEKELAAVPSKRTMGW